MSLGVGVLHNGEEVLWTGKPARQSPIDWIDVVACLFLLYCLGFAVVWLLLGMSGQAATFSLLACLPVVLFLIRKRSTAVTYVVTNRRVLTQSPQGIDAVPLGSLPDPVVINQHADGVGTISFGPPGKVAQAVAVTFRGPGATHPRMQLIQVPEAQHVASVIQAARRG